MNNPLPVKCSHSDDCFYPGCANICFLIEPIEHDNCFVHNLNRKEPAPIKNDHPAVWDLVMKDIQERDKIGEIKYSTRLQPFNGRDALVDAYQEALDLVVYLRQAIYERDMVKK